MKNSTPKLVGWRRPALLTALLFAGLAMAVAIAGRYTRTMEGMMFGFDATSDDLTGGYMDNADADIKNEIRWKVTQCSTITPADLKRSVDEAKRTQKFNDARNFIAPPPLV
jgi:hypothetical protein